MYGDHWCLKENALFQIPYTKWEGGIIKTGFCKHHMQLFSFLFNQEFGDFCKTVSNNLNLSPNHRCLQSSMPGLDWDTEGTPRAKKIQAVTKKQHNVTWRDTITLNYTIQICSSSIVFALETATCTLFFHLKGFFSSFLNLPMPILASSSSGKRLLVFLEPP